jgi:hypothetical protein
MFIWKVLIAQTHGSDDPERSCSFQVIGCLEQARRDSKSQAVSAKVYSLFDA